jgi:hypothetical protein
MLGGADDQIKEGKEESKWNRYLAAIVRSAEGRSSLG